jgi:eukaryotic-like serine/threonine-protein kinase
MNTPVSAGAVIGGKYRIERILGSGGMSVVALARHIDLERDVAIKFLSADLDRAECAERFRREARAAARIRSQHVARILDFGTLADDQPFLVMEYLEGNDLAQELERRGTLPVREIVDYLLQAIEALSEAHAAGIVHRDIKPENLFLAHLPDRTRSIKVLDFGISRSLPGGPANDLSLTRTTAFIGSPSYMSPEQMRSPRLVDHRTDIWAIGAVLYEAVSGRLPYLADTIPELCTRVLQERPPPLSALCADLPDGFERVVFRCLEKDRELRYSNLAELARALSPFCPGSHGSVERASRILTFAGNRPALQGTLDGIAPAPRVPPQPAERATARRPRAKARNEPRRSRVQAASDAARTLSPWGKTAPPNRGEGRVRPWALALTLLGVAVVAAPLFSRPPAPASAQGALTAPKEPVPPVVSPAGLVAEPMVARADAPPSEAARCPESTAKSGECGPAPITRSGWFHPNTIALPSLQRAPRPAPVDAAPPTAPAPHSESPPPRRLNPWDPSTFGGRQ